jgi:AcrR family transcriptional regulator
LIIEAAARLFRERGFGGIGVADLMKEAGLTHGGFYGHFASKDDLSRRRLPARSPARWRFSATSPTGRHVILYLRSPAPT